MPMKPFALGQTAAILVSAHEGLGKPINLLNPKQIRNVDKADLSEPIYSRSAADYFKTQYIAMLLYVICICLAKLSVVVMIGYIVSCQRDRRILWVTGGIIFAWAFAAFWVSVFQCHGPHVWNISNGQCINQVSVKD